MRTRRAWSVSCRMAQQRRISCWPIRRAPAWGSAVVAQLVRLAPPRLTIVACDPATLARDLAGLMAGGYRLERLTMIDLFPQTFHIEAIAQLRKG